MSSGRRVILRRTASLLQDEEVERSGPALRRTHRASREVAAASECCEPSSAWGSGFPRCHPSTCCQARSRLLSTAVPRHVSSGFSSLVACSSSEFLRSTSRPFLSVGTLPAAGFSPSSRCHWKRPRSRGFRASLCSALGLSQPLGGLLRFQLAGLFHPAATSRVLLPDREPRPRSPDGERTSTACATGRVHAGAAGGSESDARPRCGLSVEAGLTGPLSAWEPSPSGCGETAARASPRAHRLRRGCPAASSARARQMQPGQA